MDFINAKNIEAAVDYVPLRKKEEFCEFAAQRCLERLTMSVGGSFVPDLYREDISTKQRFLMGFFIKEYLGLPFDPVKDGGGWLLAQDDYDRFAGKHILNCMERLKADPNVRGKVFDILQDYKEVEKRLNTEIYAILQTQNDLCARLKILVMDMFKTATPEDIEKSLKELNQTKDDIDSYIKSKQEKADGEGTNNA